MIKKSILYALLLCSQLLNGQSTLFTYDPNGNIIKKTAPGQGPTLQITGVETICPGDTLVWTASGGQTYAWSNGASGATLQVVPTASGQYSVTTTAANNCTAVKSRSVTVLPQPYLGFIQQTSPQGAPGPVAYSTVGIAGATYTWAATNGTILSGQGTSAVQVQWNAGSQDALTVFAISSQGCKSDTASFTPSGEDEQFIPLNQGWNLVSTYIAPFDYSTPAVFGDLMQAGILERVKTIDKLYNPSLPAGNSLLEIEDGAGYWVRVNQPATWNVSGLKLDPLTTPIQLLSGWNLIGYLPNHPLPVQEALASVMPQVSFVKNIFASFDPAAWPILNTLQEMGPGQGYWVRMNAPATLVYPADNLQGPVVEDRSGPPENDWHQLVVAYPGSMSAYGLVTLNGGPVEPGQLILATVGDEVRGAGLTVMHEGQSYVTLVMNGVEPEEASFHLVQQNEVLLSSFKLTTAPGFNMTEYLPLAFGGVNGVNTANGSELRSSLFPNPSNGTCTLRLDSPSATSVTVSLLDITGRDLKLLLQSDLTSAGTHDFKLDFSPLKLPAGMYSLKVQTGAGIHHHNLIIQQP